MKLNLLLLLAAEAEKAKHREVGVPLYLERPLPKLPKLDDLVEHKWPYEVEAEIGLAIDYEVK